MNSRIRAIKQARGGLAEADHGMQESAIAGLLNGLFGVAAQAVEVVLDRTVIDLPWQDLLDLAKHKGVSTWRRKKADIQRELIAKGGNVS